MKILIVYAHHEIKSFNAVMKDLAVSVLTAEGHNVRVSDLYAKGFNPVAGKNDFTGWENPDYTQYMMEQKYASGKELFSDDIRKEQEDIRWADFIIIQSPIWWFSLPAILKGWFDRVFAAGFSWDFGGIYDKGLLRGKRSMLSITTGGPKEFYSKEGPHGATIDEMLHHVTHGTLFFCGLDVLPTFVAWSVFQIGDEGRKACIEEYRQRLKTLETTESMKGYSF